MAISKKHAALLLSTLGLLAGPALADTIELKNGRKIEGKVLLSEDPRVVKIQLENGSIDLPRSQVADIVETVPPEDQYAERFQKTDLDDPDAVERLASWARSIGLENRAQDLRDLAAGVRLEKRVRAARAANDANAFVQLEDWARSKGYSLEVRRFLLESARRIDGKSASLRVALDRLELDEQPPVAPPPQKGAPMRFEDDAEAQGRERAALDRERVILDDKEREREELVERIRYWRNVFRGEPAQVWPGTIAPGDAPSVIAPLAGSHVVTGHPVDGHAVDGNAVSGHPVDSKPVPSHVVTGHPVTPPPSTDPSSSSSSSPVPAPASAPRGR